MVRANEEKKRETLNFRTHLNCTEMVIGQSKTENYEPFIFDASTINCVEENCIEENDSNLECLFEDNWLMQVKENSFILSQIATNFFCKNQSPRTAV